MSWEGGQRLRRLRMMTGLDMRDVARFADVLYASWTGWERGDCKPTPRNQEKICRALSKLLSRRVAWEEVDG